MTSHHGISDSTYFQQSFSLVMDVWTTSDGSPIQTQIEIDLCDMEPMPSTKRRSTEANSRATLTSASASIPREAPRWQLASACTDTIRQDKNDQQRTPTGPQRLHGQPKVPSKNGISKERGQVSAISHKVRQGTSKVARRLEFSSDSGSECEEIKPRLRRDRTHVPKWIDLEASESTLPGSDSATSNEDSSLSGFLTSSTSGEEGLDYSCERHERSYKRRKLN